MKANSHNSHASKGRNLLLRKRWFVVSAAFVIVLLGSVTAHAFYYQNRMAPRTRIAGVEVGGMTLPETQEAITKHIGPWKKAEISYTYKTQEWKVSNEKLEVLTDAEEVVKKAYQKDKQGNIAARIGHQLGSWAMPQRFDIHIQPLTEASKKYLVDTILKEIETPFQETAISFTPGNVRIVPGVEGSVFNYDRFYEQQNGIINSNKPQRVALELRPSYPEVKPEQAETARQQAADILMEAWSLSFGTTTETLTPSQLAAWMSTSVSRDASKAATGLNLVLNDDKIATYLKNQAKKLDKKPVNAVLTAEGEGLTVVKDGISGFQVKQPETATVMKQLLLAERPAGAARSIEAVTEVVQADVRQDTVASLGLKEKIGTATTDYTGSTVNRVHNITVGQQALSGHLVKSGETFSTTGTLGPVDETTGYKPELVIKGSRTIPEYGGGLCQVSTTLFRSVLNAGLPIVERTNHAYRVGYYERGVGPGLDATVYIPNPDFKWKNDMGTAVYVLASIKGKTITFDLYGTRDGRVSSVSAPKIISETPAGAPIIAYSDTMYKDEKKQLETAHSGAKTLVVYTVTREGREIYHKDIYSTYKAWPAQYLVGTKERPPAEPVAPAASEVPSPSPEVIPPA